MHQFAVFSQVLGFMRWNCLKLSLLGRIAAIKMNVLPRVLYLLQTIPIIKKKEHFKNWQREITNFMWAGKEPRIKFKILCDARERRGLQLPNLEICHEAICLTWIRDWILLQDQKLLMLKVFNKIYGWHAYMMYDKVRMDMMFKHHYVRNSLLQVWLKYNKYLPKERPLRIVPEEVIYSLAGRKDKEQYRSKDIVNFEKDEAVIKSQEELRHKYNWWRYSQFKNLFNRDKKVVSGNKTELENIILGDSVKMISKIYVDGMKVPCITCGGLVTRPEDSGQRSIKRSKKYSK